ncbi:MAG: site-specific DNA-methyltransferase [candidate division KSB1 bacterium]|nr:site-specific DNA-methyltransferase [candidate division KSB1 bacterium]MDZ7368574.1 site-specific DNA-methyltransferase [candidate division KSB1 bacterium]MDZ7406388.1 site-specific DNA-methyltransferase [candidate division KSB1 bacterium]
MEQLKTHHRIILGDSRAMAEVKDSSVHLVITSPPYWQLKDYGHEDQIGFNDTYEDYINNLNLVWNECYRVLYPGCRLCVNIGDQFARSVYYGRYKIIPIRTEIIKFCETIGFDYMGAIIWQKVTTVNTSGGATIMGSFPYPRNGIVKLDYEFILLFKKLGKSPKPTSEQKERSKLTTEEWNEYFYGHWNFPGEKQNQHLAAFPEELPRRLIRMFSFVGDIVLDPFFGSGTTSLAARNLSRHSIGYEINKKFLPIIKSKLNIENRDLFGESATFEIIEQKPSTHDFEAEIAKLPYVFKDHVKFDKKVDPRQLRFGSKIDGKEEANGNLYSVKRVEAPDCIELDTGLKVRLLGVKPIEEKKEAAMNFIQRITKGQKVFLKFDEQKYDDNQTLLAYLFLKNKTFVNMHLIKNHLAEVDTSMDYRAKSRLLSCDQTNASSGDRA